VVSVPMKMLLGTSKGDHFPLPAKPERANTAIAPPTHPKTVLIITLNCEPSGANAALKLNKKEKVKNC